jgi:acetone carboxylase gamma subunit
MDLCCYCGKEFEKKAKGYQRSSLSSNIRVRQFEKSLKEVTEEEFGVTLTPEQKTKHFLCSTCSSTGKIFESTKHPHLIIYIMSYLYWRSYSWSFNFPGGREW